MRLAIFVSLSLMAVPTLAASPSLSIILPRGVQRGGDRELVFQGERLGDAEEVLLYGDDGIVVKSIQPVDDKSFKAVVTVPEQCPAGEQMAQVRTKSGISDYRSFWVGLLPVIDEAEPNTTPDTAQAVPLGHTVHGIITAEDVDCFAVDLKKGQRLSVEIEGLRLGSHRFDPHVSILDTKGFQFAVADDSPATLQDGILSILAPDDGRYVVKVREASYGGDDASRYRLHLGTFPRPAAVYPAGGKAGEKVTVTLLGDASGPIQREIEVPAGPIGENHRLVVGDDGGTCPTPLPFRISALANALEQEPNDEPGTATPASTTLAFNGVIERPGDVDHFRFTATKGQVFEVECHARRLRSGLDPVVHVLKADGDYLLRVKDHLDRGLPDFTYRVELAPPTPALSLSIPRVDRFSQTRQAVAVPRGNRFAVLLNVTRTNFDGDLVVDGSQLPPGVTMTAPPITAGQTQIPVVFEAAADAPLAGRLIRWEARHVTEQDPQGAAGARGHFTNSADFVSGDPNNAVYYAGRVEKLAVAVVEAVPFSVELVPPQGTSREEWRDRPPGGRKASRRLRQAGDCGTPLPPRRRRGGSVDHDPARSQRGRLPDQRRRQGGNSLVATPRGRRGRCERHRVGRVSARDAPGGRALHDGKPQTHHLRTRPAGEHRLHARPPPAVRGRGDRPAAGPSTGDLGP